MPHFSLSLTIYCIKSFMSTFFAIETFKLFCNYSVTFSIRPINEQPFLLSTFKQMQSTTVSSFERPHFKRLAIDGAKEKFSAVAFKWFNVNAQNSRNYHHEIGSVSIVAFYPGFCVLCENFSIKSPVPQVITFNLAFVCTFGRISFANGLFAIIHINNTYVQWISSTLFLNSIALHPVDILSIENFIGHSDKEK